MGTAFRVFLVGDDDSLRRIPIGRYEKMLKADPKESLPEYAGKRLRYALVILDLVNRKPLQIEEIQYSYLSFDAQGRLDQADFEKQIRLAMEVIGSSDSDQKTGRVIYARHRFAEKRLQDQYRWIPSPGLETAIVNATLGKR